MGEARKAFCKHCNKEVAFATQGRQVQVVYDGRAYAIRRQIALCNKCGTALPYEPYEVAARATLKAAVKDGAGVATPEQIHQLPRKYSIGKRPLSRLLGWGELTYTRLLDGRTPNKAHSDEIIHLLENPAAYARILEIGHNRGIITGIAYKKSRRAVDELLAEIADTEGGSHDALKAFAVADRLCALAEGDLTPRMLQTLMRLAQEASIDAGTGPLFDTEAIETDWGVEYPQIAIAYSFEDIQAAAHRLKDTVNLDEDAPAAPTAPAADASFAPAAPSADASFAPAAPSERDDSEGIAGASDEASADEPEEDSPSLEPAENRKSKKGKKGKGGKLGKKGKKAKKDKKLKKGKKAKKRAEAEEADGIDAEDAMDAKIIEALEAADAAEISEAPDDSAEPDAAPDAEPDAAETQPGTLSRAECALVDTVFIRYKRHMDAGLARSFR